ncbi:unnamed protein product [Sphagnum troendelagicum]|uniref:Uncharacterized protein n=1 Tax=Sphagnum troendelagicum TaxID=128251 RepID=A0ABP0UPU1_9BRYO
MHLVSGSETYKTASSAVTQALGRIEEVPIKGLIQVRCGPGTDVEVLPLTVVNLVQRCGVGRSYCDGADTQERTPESSESEGGSILLCGQGTDERRRMQEPESNSDSSEDSDEGTPSISPVEDTSEFEDTNFEDLIREEGLHQIMQMTMQDKADELMKEELTDDDDYADWIRWAADEEQRMQNVSEAAMAAEESVLLQDDPVTQQGMGEAAEKVVAVRPDQHPEWFEKLKRSSGLADHHMRGLGVNHGGSSDPHHLFVVDAVNAVEKGEETNRGVEEIEVVEDEELDATVGERKHKKNQVKYYNRRQQFELVLAAQELSGIRGYEIETTIEGEGTKVKGSDIWQDATYCSPVPGKSGAHSEHTQGCSA